MAQYVLGVYQTVTDATRAVQALQQAGFDASRIRMLSQAQGQQANMSPAQTDIGSLGMSGDEMMYYRDRLAAGGTLVGVDAAGREAEAHMILLRAGAENAQQDTTTDTGTTVNPADTARPVYPTQEAVMTPRGDNVIETAAGGGVLNETMGPIYPGTPQDTIPQPAGTPQDTIPEQAGTPLDTIPQPAGTPQDTIGPTSYGTSDVSRTRGAPLGDEAPGVGLGDEAPGGLLGDEGGSPGLGDTPRMAFRPDAGVGGDPTMPEGGLAAPGAPEASAESWRVREQAARSGDSVPMDSDILSEGERRIDPEQSR